MNEIDASERRLAADMNVLRFSPLKTEAGRPPLGGPPLLLSTPNPRYAGEVKLCFRYSRFYATRRADARVTERLRFGTEIISTPSRISARSASKSKLWPRCSFNS